MATQTEDQFAGRPWEAAQAEGRASTFTGPIQWPVAPITPKTPGASMSEINKAIAQVMGKVGSVKKGGENEFHRYKYATAADILHKLQPLCAEAGLIIFQNEQSVELLHGDSVMRATYEFSLAHTSGEERAPIIRSGVSGARNTKGGFDDKALNKCSTAALKYFLLNLFQIPTGDYDDADKDEDKKAETITQEQADALALRIEKCDGDIKLFCGLFGIGTLADLPANRLAEANQRLLDREQMLAKEKTRVGNGA